MPYHLQNQAFQLILHPDRSSWDLHSHIGHATHMLNVRMSIHYQTDHKHIWALDHWLNHQLGKPEIINTPHGSSQQLTAVIGPDSHGLEFRLLFALPNNEPIFLWQVQVYNHSTKVVHLEQIELLNIGFINISDNASPFALRQSIARSDRSLRGAIQFPSLHALKNNQHHKDLAFYSNGWQSWSYSGIYLPANKYRPTRLGPLRQPMIENNTTSRPKNARMFRSDMFGILGDRSSRIGLLAGFLSQKNQFGSLEVYLDPFDPAMRLWASGDAAQLDPGDKTETDWACLCPLHLDDPDPLGTYLEAVAREYSINLPAETPSPRGWCSWYYYSSKDYTGTVTPQDIRLNAQTAANLKQELPLEFIQIDDGFQNYVGDWFTFKPGFPEGLAPISAEIRQEGMSPGLWLAPFVVHPKSNLYHQHPDWLLRNRLHRPVNAGFSWNSFITSLDLTHPDALEYCQQVVHRSVHEWGYNYLKLDYLYAAALPGRFHNPHKTRAQVLRESLMALRTAAGPEAFLLGCGCPLGPAIGIVDSMRIGTDTTRTWYPSYQGIETYFKRDLSLPSARCAIHNALTRAPMHRRWWINDPDCLLLRPETALTMAELQTIATVIALTGGSLFLSDDLSQLPQERLRIAQVLLPLINKRPYILDWFDQPTPTLIDLDLSGAIGDWSLLAVINWQDESANKELRLNQTYLNPDQTYLVREYWSGRHFQVDHGYLTLPKIPPHGVCLLALKPMLTQKALYAGSDLHISQGLEVTKWEAGPSKLLFHVERPGQSEGSIDLHLPKPPHEVVCNENIISWQTLEQNYYRIPLIFYKQARIIVYY